MFSKKYIVEIELKSGSVFKFKFKLKSEAEINRVLAMVDKAWQDKLNGFVQFQSQFFCVEQISRYSVQKKRTLF